MKTVLLSLCFEYKEESLVFFYKDVELIRSIANFDHSVLLTDSLRSFDCYDKVITNPTLEDFKQVLETCDSIENSIFVYIAGHGIMSGFLWHDNRVLCLEDVFESIKCDVVAIIDACNAPIIRLPYVYIKGEWKLGSADRKKAVQVAFVSSIKGINSKMKTDGSVFTKIVVKAMKSFEGSSRATLICRSVDHSRIYSTTPCWKTLTTVIDRFAKSPTQSI